MRWFGCRNQMHARRARQSATTFPFSDHRSCSPFPPRFEGIYFVRCAAHGADLAFEDIFKMDYFKDAASEARSLISYMSNHHSTAAAWKQLPGTKALLLPATTRFGSNFIKLERVSEMESKLQQLVVSDLWDVFVATLSGRDAKEAAAAVKRTAMNSRLFTKISTVRGLSGCFAVGWQFC